MGKKEESSGPSNKCAERRIALQMVLENGTALECTATFSKFSAQLQNLNCLKDAFSGLHQLLYFILNITIYAVSVNLD